MATSFLVVKNRAISKLAAAVNDSTTTFTVTAGEGANFPSTYPFHLTLEDEIVSVTNRATDTLTVVRAQQSTSAAAHSNKVAVQLNITAKSITDLNTAVNTMEAYDVLTTRGDIIFRNATVPARLAKGADNTILAMGANDPEWKTPAAIMGDLSGQAAAAFNWNSQNLTGIGTVNTHTIPGGTGTLALTSDISSDIATHAALATVHQDAPALITSHASDIDAHVSGATAGEVLVATGAATAVWQNTGVKLTAPDIQGVVTAAGALTMPAFIMGGMIDVNGQAFGDGTDELLTFTEAASPVNQIDITNAATGERPIIGVKGDDTNIDLCLLVKGTGHVDIPFTLPSTAGQELDGLLISVDSSAQAATAVFQAFHVETTGTPSGAVEAVTTVGKVAPVHQHVTSPVTPDQGEFAGRKTGGGTSWVDAIDAIEIFIVNSDEIYVGAVAQFDEIEVIMTTPATKDCVPTFWYNTAADSWTQFFPSDGTAGFVSSGNISWTLGDISGLWTGDGDPGAGETTAGYWIKIIRTRAADPGTPTPATIKIGAATQYEWSKDGNLTIAQVTTAILYGSGSTYLRIGNANTTQHSLASEDDLMVTGKLEVGGLAFFDSTVTMVAPDISGVVTAAAALTMPAFTAGAVITSVAGLIHPSAVDNSFVGYRGGTAAAGKGAAIFLNGADNTGALLLATPNAAKTADVTRLTITGNLATAVATWADITHTGIVLSGALDGGGQAFTSVLSITGSALLNIKSTAGTIQMNNSVAQDIRLWGTSAGLGRAFVLDSTNAGDGATNDSPALRLKARYDADPGGGVANTERNYDIIHDMQTAGASPKSSGVHKIAGVTVLTLENDDGTVRTIIAGTLAAHTLSGPLTLNGQALDAGAGILQVNTTGSLAGIQVNGSHDDNGPRLKLNHSHTTPEAAKFPGEINVAGFDGAGTPAAFTWGRLRWVYANVGDGTEAGRLDFYLPTGGADNIPMTLSGAGELGLDLGVNADEYYKVAGTQVVSAQGAAVADSSDAASVILRLNELLARLRTHGMIAT